MIDPGYDPKLVSSDSPKREIKGDILVTTISSKPTPRYYVDPNEHHYFWLDSEFRTGKHDLRDFGLKKIFVNVLKMEKRYFHIKMFLKDGQTQEAYLPTYYDDAIRIHGMDLLLDGRFNI